jgi:cyclopropane fatty-acyl-phospholipid synthase-like methyltransferase|tara:strand:- start:470 stop:1174 length:705 start_codon:yes stop_codon:yes gene_type:complete
MVNIIMDNYPEVVTERFDNANFHINYCLKFIKKYIKGNVLEVGAGCGSFTRNYINQKIHSITLTELDDKNILDLKKSFASNSRVRITKNSIYNIKQKFDTIIYLHVLEHIKNDKEEIEEASKKLNQNGTLIIMVPAHQKIYSNLDKAVGHFRRYEKEFFKRDFNQLKIFNIKFLDSMGYFLYYLNKLFFKKEVYPSKIKIFIWDKLFTPISIVADFIFRYKFGKCILAIYKKSS